MEDLIHFLKKIRIGYTEVIGKNKTLILCGDWNINFLQSSPQKSELNGLFLLYNLKYIVNVPTRITKNTSTLLDVVITNDEKSTYSLRVMNLGLSGHHTQIISILITDSRNRQHRIKKTQFSKANLQEFFYSLNEFTWQEVYEESDVNIKFSIFRIYFFIFIIMHFLLKQFVWEIKLKIIGLLKELKFPVKRCDS